MTNTHVIASKKDLITRNILKKYDVNIIKPEWILDCVKSNILLEYLPRYMIHCVEWLKKSIKEKYDEFGDPYFRDTSVNDLRNILNTMRVDKSVEIKEAREQIKVKCDIFQGEKFYLRKKL